MIPEIFVEQWRSHCEWQQLGMIEQDLIISRALICLYNHALLKNSLVFRGGTALNKLFIHPPARYSEDIDFVQIKSEPIGSTIDAIRDVLQSWLGEPKRKLTERSAKLIYSYQTVDGLPAKLKIEINTTEHFHVLPIKMEPFSVQSEWFTGSSLVATYQLEELMATKLRALYQRRKGRDLFDLWYVCQQNSINIDLMLSIFQHYCQNEKTVITKELFLSNIALKQLNNDFTTDMNVLLPRHITWNFDEAFNFVQDHIIKQLP